MVAFAPAASGETREQNVVSNWGNDDGEVALQDLVGGRSLDEDVGVATRVAVWVVLKHEPWWCCAGIVVVLWRCGGVAWWCGGVVVWCWYCVGTNVILGMV